MKQAEKIDAILERVAQLSDLPERITALEVSIKGNGTKGLGERMNEAEKNLYHMRGNTPLSTLTVLKLIGVIVAVASGTAGVSHFIG